MTTKAVGIRELKEQAPKLVQRAEKGERTVITRHGRPVAVLAPVSEAESIHAQSPRARVWQREREQFERLLPKLGRRYGGRFVALLEGKVIDSDPDAAKLFQRVAGASGGGVFFIGGVGVADSLVELPGFTLE
ncbi:MAG TPA: type II toxin-antitoxin system prevent-host-death family antitoxin [Polyangiaceae bacterium]